VARAPQDVHAHRHDPRRRFAPDAAQNAPEATRSPQRARSRADASQKPVPRARRSAGAYRGARTAGRSRPQTRSAPALRAVSIHAFRGEGDPTPRSPYRARRSAGACRGARTDRRTSPHRRYAPAPPRTRQEPPRTRQEPARSPYRARSRAEASQKPVPRQKPGRSAHRARRRPERARSQPQAPTARYFASARSPIRSGFDCDARALRNCNSTRPSCARRRRRSASVIGCGRPAWSHRMHSSFVRVGFSFLLHVHAGRYGCSASGFHSLTSSRSRNRSSSVRE